MNKILNEIQTGNIKTLARAISIVENEAEGFEEILLNLSQKKSIPIIGITGSPGAGKSTLTDAMIGYFVQQNKKVAVLCVDPSSPFNLGALLGDRIRMNEWYNHPNVFIRSLATRGNLGGLNPKIIEITELIKTANFDFIIIETVGVGQSEIEIASLADTTVLVLVPDAGDEVQTMKAGLMEIADVLVVNKADKSGADELVKNLHLLLRQKKQNTISIIKTIASQKKGIDELMHEIFQHQQQIISSDKKILLLAEKCYQLIQKNKMKNIDKKKLIEIIKEKYHQNNFNLYKIANEFK
ncbi:MAG: methylmalonyl Co-A mutase-associated GTPase MeaB [Chitinophagaceae bacterium]